MSSKEWKRFYHAQSLINGEDAIREMVREGTYAGIEPIADEWELDRKLKQVRREVEAGRMFHFDNALNSYDTNEYHVESEEDRISR